ncbi:thioredoxin family protein [Cellulomonas sp. HZM]|uniref:thioredoxin family protein n=1 Tax=Cellulomonas sp. HZM TaxID=1454010 RepID=UPI000A8231DD|nr:thioredoxin family protein [Cellulomonas sp. HZM]
MTDRPEQPERPGTAVRTATAPSGVVGAGAEGHVVLTADDLGSDLGRSATVVQLSSTFCQPCRMTRLVVERAVATTADVAYVDLDVAEHLALGERLGVDVTPTVLVLDAGGSVRHRATGVPRLAQVRAAIAAAQV